MCVHMWAYREGCIGEQVSCSSLLCSCVSFPLHATVFLKHPTLNISLLYRLPSGRLRTMLTPEKRMITDLKRQCGKEIYNLHHIQNHSNICTIKSHICSSLCIIKCASQRHNSGDLGCCVDYFLTDLPCIRIKETTYVQSSLIILFFIQAAY